jgi:hypothetical protein
MMLWSSFLYVLASIIIPCATFADDDLDHAMNDALGHLHVRGASIAFFDRVRN